jgi:hypothetical protein
MDYFQFQPFLLNTTNSKSLSKKNFVLRCNNLKVKPLTKKKNSEYRFLYHINLTHSAISYCLSLSLTSSKRANLFTRLSIIAVLVK